LPGQSFETAGVESVIYEGADGLRTFGKRGGFSAEAEFEEAPFDVGLSGGALKGVSVVWFGIEDNRGGHRP
jgi:hypothetical protein